MAIEFLQAQKRQRYLILILTLAICSILLVVWLGFFRNSAPGPTSFPTATPPTIEINWNALKDTKLEALKSFEQVPPMEDGVGRENPFTSY
ncbi:MAG: hypothetical protein UV65_C0004G0010 [Parcubacteria group bacterium GW2011_GWF2_43_11]|nr:MAG: hypothetical protein UV65_C0004G0010 [Parcubacteria group bacterium GW2011_GWF2_43_11]